MSAYFPAYWLPATVHASTKAKRTTVRLRRHHKHGNVAAADSEGVEITRRPNSQKKCICTILQFAHTTRVEPKTITQKSQ